MKFTKKAINEKDVESGYRTELMAALPNATIISHFGGDGLLLYENVRSLLEFKYKTDLKNKICQANILVQCLYYMKKYEISGQSLPTTIFVGDINECFILPTEKVREYLNRPIRWEIAPSNAHQYNPDMVKCIVDDNNIVPFVYDINDEFDIKMVIDKIKQMSAGNIVITPEARKMIAADDSIDVRYALARNREIMPEIQVILTRDKCSSVRYALALNRGIMPETEEILTRDKCTSVRCGLAYNPMITPETQLKLATDEAVEVRGTLARQKSLTPEVQIMLAKDKCSDVRFELACNRTITPEVQELLAVDDDIDIQQELARNTAVGG